MNTAINKINRPLSSVRFCIFLNDICGYSHGINRNGYTICVFDSPQLNFLHPDHRCKCPNILMFAEKSKAIYERRFNS